MRTSLAVVTLLSLCNAQPNVGSKALGQQAYLFAYPLVLMDLTREAATDSNAFKHARAFPDDKFHAIVRPNADTLYSTAWLDLSKEPMLMRVPDTHGRYYLVQILDAWTETVSVPGKRTTGTGEGWFAIAGPGWSGTLPKNVTRIDCPTNTAWIIGRTQTNGAADYKNVHAIQNGYELMPLSRYPDGVKPTPSTRAASSMPPPVSAASMNTVEFFRRFAQVMKVNPPHAADGPMMAKLETVGIRPGASFDTVPNADFEAGVSQAKQLLSTIEARRGMAMNLSSTNWSKPSPFIGRYGANYLARAVVARIGLGANPPEDAVYLNCTLDSTGAALDGKNYRIHFDKSQLPPVQAFWSITVYDSEGYFVGNPIGRYAIGDRDKLEFNADGSLDIYIQSSAPANTSNWLPSPNAPFNLSMRLYWPREEIIKGSWTPPAAVSQ